MSFSFFSLFFLALPAPLKVVVIMVGGLFFVNVKQARPMAPVQGDIQFIPAKKPAKVIAAVPVKPAKAVGAMTIIVNSDGSYNVGADKLTEAQLSKKLKATAALNPKAKILFKADALTPYQMVVSAVEVSKKAGLSNVSFSSKPEKR